MFPFAGVSGSPPMEILVVVVVGGGVELRLPYNILVVGKGGLCI